MNWEQLHVFLDITATVGGVVFTVVGFLFRTQTNSIRLEFLRELGEISDKIAAHSYTCDAERAELFRTQERKH